MNFLRSESLKKEEAIVYDFRLGIEYAFEYRKNQMICNIQPLNADHLQLIIGLFNHNSPRILIPNLPEFDYFGRTQCVSEEKTFTFFDKSLLQFFLSKIDSRIKSIV